MRTISEQKLWYLLLLGLLISSGCKQSSPGVREFDRNLMALSMQDFGTVEYFMMEQDISELYGVVEQRSNLYDYLDVGDTFSTYYWDVDSLEMVASHARFLTTARHSFYDTNFNLISAYGGSDAIIYWGSCYKPHPEKNGIIWEIWNTRYLNDTATHKPEESIIFYFDNGRLIKEVGSWGFNDSLIFKYRYSNERLVKKESKGAIFSSIMYEYERGILRKIRKDVTGGRFRDDLGYTYEELWLDSNGSPEKKITIRYLDTLVVSYHF